MLILIDYFLWSSLCLFIFLTSFYVFSSLYGLFLSKGVPYVPLSRKKIKFLKQKIHLPENANLIDLGCGNGRIMRFFEKQGVKNIDGYEINLWAYVWGKFLNFIFHSKTKIYLKNFNEINLAKYDYVFCYLLESALTDLKGKFEKELKPGTKIITYDFSIANWRQPAQFYESHERWVGRIYVYEINRSTDQPTN